MSPYSYTNGAGGRYALPEKSLAPPDARMDWRPAEEDPEEMERSLTDGYDRQY